MTPLVLAAALTLMGFNVDLMSAWLGFEAILAGAALLYAGTGCQGPGRLIDGLTDVLDRTGSSYPNPLGIFPRHGWFSGLVAVAYGLTLVAAVLSVASVFARRRGASTERRKQLAWLRWVGLLTVFWLAALGVCNMVTHGAGS